LEKYAAEKRCFEKNGINFEKTGIFERGAEYIL
jgi:hypothetical protein